MHIQNIALMFVAHSGLCVIIDRIFVFLVVRRLNDVFHRYDRNLSAALAPDGFGDAKLGAFFRIARKHQEAEQLVRDWFLDSSATKLFLSWELSRPTLYWSAIGTSLAVAGVFLSDWFSVCAVPVLCLGLLTFWQSALLGRSWWRKLGAFADKLDAQYELWEYSLSSEPCASSEETSSARRTGSDPGPQTLSSAKSS